MSLVHNASTRPSVPCMIVGRPPTAGTRNRRREVGAGPGKGPRIGGLGVIVQGSETLRRHERIGRRERPPRRGRVSG